MTKWTSDTLGDGEDDVKLIVDGTEVKVAESYDVRVGVLNQPGTFAMTLGHADAVAGLIQRFPINAPFQLKINGSPQMTGKIEVHRATDDEGSQLSVEGSDRLAELTYKQFQDERSYTDATYFDLVSRVLDEAGMHPYTLFPDNSANRKVMSGAKVQQKVGSAQSKIIGADTGVTDKVVRTVRARVGEIYWEFLKRHLEPGAIFLRAAADGNFVLGAPDGTQKPVQRIMRYRGRSPNIVNAKLAEYYCSARPPRYTTCTYFARVGGRKHRRTLSEGAEVDEEMFNVFGIKDRALCVHDSNVHNVEEAETMARRKLAEGRRNCWRLTYQLRGHTAPAIDTGEKLVWTPDTCVHVVDDWLGFDEVLWVESVIFRRSPQTETVVNLMRTKDLIFEGIDTGE